MRKKSSSSAVKHDEPYSLSRLATSWQSYFWIISGTALVAMPLMSLGYGIIWDEWIQSQYGKLVLKFLMSWGRDQSALKFGETMYLYGGLFDSWTAALYGILFDTIKNVSHYPLQADFIAPHWHDTRHMVNAFFGFTAILFTGLCARQVGTWRAGVFALAMMLFSPRFFGNAMNNPKDIPFATGAAIFTYFMLRLISEIPKPSKKSILGLTVGIALSINIKVGGLLFLCYTGLFVGLLWLKSILTKSTDFSFRQVLKILIPVSLAGYLGGILFWPYGWTNPILHPIEALGAFSKFGGGEGKLLFEGLIYKQGTTPWYYLPQWILISSPIFLTASIFLFGFIANKLFLKTRAFHLSFLLFSVLFPLVYAILGKAIVYDSWRHFLFVYPPLIILAALTWDYLLIQADTSLKKFCAWLVLILFLAEPLSWMIRNHPNETSYFNPLVGGLRGAYGHYETDYWGNCLRPASEELARLYREKNQLEPVVIRADGEPISSYPFLVKGLGRLFIPNDPKTNNWKYSLEFSRSREPQTLLNGEWPGPHAIYVVSAEQVPLCAIIERK